MSNAMARWLVLAMLSSMPLTGLGQQIDMETMAKWGAADVVRYHIVGVFQGTSYVASDGAGQGDFTDRVVIDLTWKLSEAKMVGAATIQNSKSAVSKLRDREPMCLPPVLKGDLEFYELLAVREGLGGALHFTVRTTFPVVEVAQSCTASRKPVPAKVREEIEDFGVLSPVMLGMPLPKSDELAVTPDKKSFIVRKKGWTWTLTPSLTK